MSTFVCLGPNWKIQRDKSVYVEPMSEEITLKDYPLDISVVNSEWSSIQSYYATLLNCDETSNCIKYSIKPTHGIFVHKYVTPHINIANITAIKTSGTTTTIYYNESYIKFTSIMDKLSYFEFKSIMYQIILATRYLHAICEWTHYNLTIDSIYLETSDTMKYIRYGDYYTIAYKYIVKICDLNVAYIRVVKVSSLSTEPHGMFMKQIEIGRYNDKSNPNCDIFKFLSTFHVKYQRTGIGDNEYIGVLVENLLSFFVKSTNVKYIKKFESQSYNIKEHDRIDRFCMWLSMQEAGLIATSLTKYPTCLYSTYKNMGEFLDKVSFYCRSGIFAPGENVLRYEEHNLIPLYNQEFIHPNYGADSDIQYDFFPPNATNEYIQAFEAYFGGETYDDMYNLYASILAGNFKDGILEQKLLGYFNYVGYEWWVHMPKKIVHRFLKLYPHMFENNYHNLQVIFDPIYHYPAYRTEDIIILRILKSLLSGIPNTEYYIKVLDKSIDYYQLKNLI